MPRICNKVHVSLDNMVVIIVCDMILVSCGVAKSYSYFYRPVSSSSSEVWFWKEDWQEYYISQKLIIKEALHETLRRYYASKTLLVVVEVVLKNWTEIKCLWFHSASAVTCHSTRSCCGVRRSTSLSSSRYSTTSTKRRRREGKCDHDEEWNTLDFLLTRSVRKIRLFF